LPYPIPLPPTHSLRPNATPPTSLYTLSLHDALPISHKHRVGPLGFLANHIHLLLRALRGVHVFDADLLGQVGHFGLAVARYQQRSEEHTSELQSREKLVCRLLLEKKKKK